MYTGPKVTNNNLVFGYDTGYGIADTATSTRFYPGEPTTNLQSSNQTSGIVNSMSGISIAHVGEEGGWQKYSMNGTFTGGTYPYIMYLPNTSFTGGTKYSTQVKIKTNVPNKFNYFGTGINYVNQPMDHGGTSSSTVLADGSRLAKREGFAYTSSVSQPGYIKTNPINNTTFSSSTDFVYVKDFQVEQQDHCTPHTSTSRSNTTSLIDLKRTEAITVANMSFDSTGQPTFDGTNDYIELDDALNSLGGFATFEAVFKATETNNNFRVILGWGNGTSNFSGLHIGSWTSSYTDESLHVGLNSSTLQMFVRKGETFYKDNAFHHVIVTAGLNNYSIWIDGVEETFTFKHGSQSTAFTQIVGYNSNIDSQIGSRPYPTSRGYFKGEIPVVKVYNRILSDDEIKRNYKAYKNRFNI